MFVHFRPIKIKLVEVPHAQSIAVDNKDLGIISIELEKKKAHLVGLDVVDVFLDGMPDLFSLKDLYRRLDVRCHKSILFPWPGNILY